jgi:hypothetical protein
VYVTEWTGRKLLWVADGKFWIWKLGCKLKRRSGQTWVWDPSGKMDRRRDVKTVCSDIQRRINLMKLRERTSVASTGKWKRVGEIRIYILFHYGLDRECGNWGEIGKLHLYFDILNIALGLRPFLLVAGRMGEGGDGMRTGHTSEPDCVLLSPCSTATHLIRTHFVDCKTFYTDRTF